MGVLGVTGIDSELHERNSFCDRHKKSSWKVRRVIKSEIVVFAKDATPGSTEGEHEEKGSHVPSKRKAATLGRTTDLRIIAEAAIPRSTTELQQLIKLIVSNMPHVL